VGRYDLPTPKDDLSPVWVEAFSLPYAFLFGLTTRAN